ncbi:hypothetical protein NDU88_008127, partial [Pleurodeles waltl]
RPQAAGQSSETQDRLCESSTGPGVKCRVGLQVKYFYLVPAFEVGETFGVFAHKSYGRDRPHKSEKLISLFFTTRTHKT